MNKRTKVNQEHSSETYRLGTTLEEWIDREIERCRKAYQGGNLGALNDVLSYCDEFKVTLPKWASKALHIVLKDSLTGNTAKTRGRHAKWIRKYREDMIDFGRADTVRDCLEHNIRWDDVYGAAYEILKGTYAEGSEDAIEKSYKRYMKRIKTNPYRYMMLRTIPIGSVDKIVTPESLETWEYIHSLRRKKKK